jgi:hypothetical protein
MFFFDLQEVITQDVSTIIIPPARAGPSPVLAYFVHRTGLVFHRLGPLILCYSTVNVIGSTRTTHVRLDQAEDRTEICCRFKTCSTIFILLPRLELEQSVMEGSFNYVRQS